MVLFQFVTNYYLKLTSHLNSKGDQIMKRKRILFGVFVIINASAQAASFDCSKAKTFHEKTVCDIPSIGKLDEEMAAKYKEALRKDSIKTRDDQKAWLKEMKECTDAKCIHTGYLGRITELNAASSSAERSNQFKKLNKNTPSSIAAIHIGDEVICKITSQAYGDKVTKISNVGIQGIEVKFNYNNELRVNPPGNVFNGAVSAGNEIQEYEGKIIKTTRFLKINNDKQESVSFFLAPDGMLTMATKSTVPGLPPISSIYACSFKK